MRVAGNLDRLSPEENSPRNITQGLVIPRDLSQFPTDDPAKDTAAVRFPIRLKVTLPYLILALIIAMAGAYIITQLVFDTIEERFTNQLIEAGKIAAEWMVKEETELLETLRLVARTEGTGNALRDGNAEELRVIAYPILLNASADALEIVDMSGESVLSLRRRPGGLPEQYDVSRGERSFQDWDVFNKVRDQESDKQGDKYAGIASAGWGDYLYVSGPILDEDGSLAGVILVGDSLAKVAEEIRATTLSQVTLFNLEGKEIVTTFIESGSQLDPLTAHEILTRQDADSLMQEHLVASIPYQAIFAPLEVRSGEDVGIIATSLAKTFLVRASNTTRLEIFGFITTAFLFIIAIGLFVADRFTKPLLKVVDASSQVASGNLDVAVTPKGNDEVTALAKSFNQMVASLQRSKSDLIRAHEDTIQAYDRTIEGWCKALELRDNVTEGHTQRVTELTLLIASQMGISEQELVHIRRGALMHDIGKMGIPDSILKKPGPLDVDEWKEMRRHPVYAYEMLNRIDYLAPAIAIPYCHHEKWDGSGYPRGIQGDEIPIEARIFAIADVWDALRSDRPYRDALPASTALEYVQENRGTHFDPQVVEAFLIVYEKHLVEPGNSPSLDA